MMRATEAVPSGSSVVSALVLGVAVSCTCVPCLVAQTTAPALGATSVAATPAATTPARHSSVQFEGGLLTVQASNASLNGILREVARVTGMKISGSVPEDRVFGTYGPADPQVILATLLEGTGTNILIVSNEADKPLELVLTRRTGGVSPPNPNETAETSADEDADDPSARTASAPEAMPRTVGQRAPQGRNLPAPATQPSEVTQPVVFAPIGPTTAPATATTTPVDPDDPNDTGTGSAKTPQQIFEQLQNLQQAGQPAGAAQPPQ